jgi:DMSO/TMAO reductase YedYZ molybdopterin-dependent catalytic subunit
MIISNFTYIIHHQTEERTLMANRETPISALGSDITPVGSFFVRSHFPVPSVDRSSWRLSVTGDVGQAQEFSYADLRKMPQRTVRVTMECAGNGRTGFTEVAPGEVRWGPGAVSTASWTGVPLSLLLQRAGVKNGANQVIAEGADEGPEPGSTKTMNFSRRLSLEKAMSDGTILALKMNGKVLQTEHGAPARLIVPGWYAMASVKWVKALRVLSGEPFSVFFNDTKYVYVKEKDGQEVREPVTELRVKALITEPLDGESAPVGSQLIIRGKAWSGASNIVGVQIDLGEGWEDAEVDPQTGGRYAWTGWRKKWVPKSKGSVTIAVRAADHTGSVQPLEPMPNKYQYGYNAVHRIRIDVV